MRGIEHRFLLQCEVVSPLTHGSGASSPVTDNPLRRYRDGRLVVAGTSIAGALRSVVERIGGRGCLRYVEPRLLERSGAKQPCPCSVCRLFGNVVPVDSDEPASTGSTADSSAVASRVWVADAVVTAGVGSRIVDSVGIAPERRTAENSKKFDREEIPAGAKLWLDVRGEDLSADEVRCLGAALRELATGHASLGGGAASGSGRMSCQSAAIYSRDLRTRDDLLAAILHDSHELPAKAGERLAAWPAELVAANLEAFGTSDDAAPAVVSWDLTLRPNLKWGGTFIVADPVSGAISGWDRAPRGLTPNHFAAELPARSVRGALRSGAYRILRTLSGDNQPLADDLRDALFGSVAKASRLRVCVDSTQQKPAPSPWDHVAIDRFTGGAAERKKFDALTARGGAFALSLRIVDVPDQDLPWMKGLLALTLRDLHEGRITIGHGSAKGHGYFELAGGSGSAGQGPDEARQVAAGCWVDAIACSHDDVQSWVNALFDRVRLSPTPSGGERDASGEATGESAEATPDEEDSPDAERTRAMRPGQSTTANQPAAPAAPAPTGAIVRTANLSTDKLLAVAESLAGRTTEDQDNYAFLESPTACLLRSWEQAAPECRSGLAGAWQFRVFGRDYELAARRLAFEGDQQWAARLTVFSTQTGALDVSEALEPFAGSPGTTVTEDIEELQVSLLGSTRERGNLFREDRFAAAENAMRYPGDFNADTNLNLRVRRLPLDGGPIVCWTGFEPEGGAT
ncbi:MAG: hypothetical protein J5I93_05025 [Pirellulaceae bacterium]|nr:hypothetical protein [Pirellulaceae bacterium]